jgi:hypothetical protein
MNTLGNQTYYIRDFQAVEGWHILFWEDEHSPGKYFKEVMPGWLTVVVGTRESLQYGTPLPERDQDVYPACLDPFGGSIELAIESHQFYRLIAPGEAEPDENTAITHWNAWKQRLENHRQARRKRDAEVNSQ